MDGNYVQREAPRTLTGGTALASHGATRPNRGSVHAEKGGQAW